MNNKPFFSVVTVCYNAGNLICKTIESVLAQSFDNSEFSFEYIIQDGLSKDDTLEIVSGYKESFKENGIDLIVNTKKDAGIYDAMNKAVSSANGEYIVFMNADDCFYSDHVLKDVYSSLDLENLPDIIYGDCIVKELGMYFKFRKTFDQIKERMPFSHQSCFAKKETLIKWPLDLDFPITADYNFLLNCYMNKLKFYDSNVIISLVTADGVSSVNMFDAFLEACHVCEIHGVPRYTPSKMKKKIIEMKIKQFVLDCFPSFIKKSIRNYQIKNRGQTIDVTLPDWAK